MLKSAKRSVSGTHYHLALSTWRDGQNNKTACRVSGLTTATTFVLES